MFEKLLPYFNEELIFIRELGSDFASLYPKIARRLKLEFGEIPDPHVERLIEGFAFLNASFRFKLDDDFSEINNALLDVLYPHYLLPIPSISVIQFSCAAGNTLMSLVPSGTIIVSSGEVNPSCSFSTIYPTEVFPIRVKKIYFKEQPFKAPHMMMLSEKCSSVLKIVLETTEKGLAFSELNISSFRFFINMYAQKRYFMYDLIMENIIGISLASNEDDTTAIFMDRTHVEAVGFKENEGLLPYEAGSSLGYRILTEYFIFPEKFLFFDIKGLNKETLTNFKGSLEIYLYLKDVQKNLEDSNLDNALLLGCTPLINLFPQKAEPIPVTQQTPSIEIIPDVQNAFSKEIYTISKVLSISNTETLEYQPFFSVNHASKVQGYWYATKKLKEKIQENKVYKQLKMYVSLVDKDLSTLGGEDKILYVDTVCTNGDIPTFLPFRGEGSTLKIENSKNNLLKIENLREFTSYISPDLGPGARWRLISHLSLNHLSLTNNSLGLEALQEILRLYSFNFSDVEPLIIDGIKSISTQKVTRRVDSNYILGSSLCQGLEITLEIDEKNFKENSLFLFGSVLNTFFNLYCNINSFTQLVIKTLGSKKEKKWEPLMGSRSLL